MNDNKTGKHQNSIKICAFMKNKAMVDQQDVIGTALKRRRIPRKINLRFKLKDYGIRET